MSEDLAGNLQQYKLQLLQVEAALTNEPENEELQKLSKDLQDVIELTAELLKAQSGESSSSGKFDVHGGTWKVGDKCQAPWSKDGQFYVAKIDEITEEGQCTVTFEEYGNTEVTTLSILRPKEGLKHPGSEANILEMSEKLRSKKQHLQDIREYKKKKAQKKAQRLKQLEEEREVEKSKWQQFNAKASSKNKKGQVKKSIFASPDNVNGRVGVGTCGIGGKPMTEYHQQEKWRKPSTS